MLHVPVLLAVVLPTRVAPSNNFMALPTSAVPVKTGEMLFVILSVFDFPESDAALRSGVETAGATVSMMTMPAAEALLVPAEFVAVAVTLCVPFIKVELVIVQFPVGSAVALPICVAPSYSFTVLPGSAVPVNTGVLILVTLSVPDEPVSEAVLRSGTEGTKGTLRV